MWNDWGDLELGVTQASFLHYARTLHRAHLPGHTVELDDGWARGYADHVFNQPKKFPHPKAMIDKIHAMGYDFEIWDTWRCQRADGSAELSGSPRQRANVRQARHAADRDAHEGSRRRYARCSSTPRC
jgi:hypothetical protein